MSAANVAGRWLQRAYPAAWVLALGGERQTTFALNNPRVSHLLCCCSFDNNFFSGAAGFKSAVESWSDEICDDDCDCDDDGYDNDDDDGDGDCD